MNRASFTALDGRRARRARGATLAMTRVDPGADFSFDFDDLAFERVAPCEAAQWH